VTPRQASPRSSRKTGLYRGFQPDNEDISWPTGPGDLWQKHNAVREGSQTVAKETSEPAEGSNLLGFDQFLDVRQVLLPADESFVIDEILLGDVESRDIAVLTCRPPFPGIGECDALQGCQEIDPKRLDAQLDDLFRLEKIAALERDVGKAEFANGLHDAIRVRRSGLDENVDILCIAGLSIVAQGETSDDQISELLLFSDPINSLKSFSILIFELIAQVPESLNEIEPLGRGHGSPFPEIGLRRFFKGALYDSHG
jgi:hypothetical protein